MTYKLKSETEFNVEMVYHVESNAWIPADPANTDYQEYLAWLEEGNVPEEWNPEEVQ